MADIPEVILSLVAEATTECNDGYAKKFYRDKLIAIRDYLNKVLEGKKED